MTNGNDTGKVLLTPEEAAARLSLGRTKVFELLAAGEIRSISIGRARRVPTDALTEFVRRRTAEQEALVPA